MYTGTSRRRIAQGQSASKYTEEGAAFDSCSAYQELSRPEILFLSHCVPNPPDKGEKIRAHHELNRLVEKYSVHLACFARTRRELADAQALTDRCVSVHAELLPFVPTLLKAALRFAAGRSLTASFFGSPRFAAHVRTLEGRVRAVVAYSTVMAQHAPAGVPLIYDMVDVDSEKWLAYGRMRFPGRAFAAEGHRLRRLEQAFASRAECTFVATEPERDLLRSFSSSAAVSAVENGVDATFFDPSYPFTRPASAPAVVFCGAMDYYPNVEAARWFADEVFPMLQDRRRDLEFWVVGRNPTRDVQALAKRNGIRVTGAVPDVRPWLAAAEHIVAPLRLARGIQNKVLEALAMGKVVLASPSVCRTFGVNLPAGVVRCDSPADYLVAPAISAEQVRGVAVQRFDWERNLSTIDTAVATAVARPLTHA